jgi:hypothetical protein
MKHPMFRPHMLFLLFLFSLTLAITLYLWNPLVLLGLLALIVAAWLYERTTALRR